MRGVLREMHIYLYIERIVVNTVYKAKKDLTYEVSTYTFLF